MRSPRSVTMAPIDMPSRSLKAAMDFLALVTTGFCPAICAQLVHRAVHQLGILRGFAQADIDRDLLDLRHGHDVLVPELLVRAGTTFF